MNRWVAVWRRNVLVWRKLALASLVGNFGEPLLYLLALGYGLGAFVGTVQGMPYIVFLASGIVCASAMNAATLEGTYSVYVRMSVQQTWDGILATPLGVNDIVFGELVWMGTKSFINAAPILLVATVLGAVHDWRALWVLPLVVLIGLCFGAMAMVVTAFARGFDFFLYYATLVITPMFLLSGVFFPVQGMPEWVRRGAQFLPLTHAIDVVRPLMTGQPLSQTGWHLIILISYTVGGFLLAARLFRRRMIS
jgi:lipooligosaccharide transport system permease protein